MSYELTQERFLKEVSAHKMQIIRDDGLYRHLRFKKDGTSSMYFDFVTWPGHFAYSGDMGSFIFTRLEDMFEFFRGAYKADGKMSIDRRYWAEKCVCGDRSGSGNSDGVTEYSPEVFMAAINERLNDWIHENKDSGHPWPAIVIEQLHSDVRSKVIANAHSDTIGYEAMRSAIDFRFDCEDWGYESGLFEFHFQDFWETRVSTYTHRFNWACFAIAWGIHQYDLELDKQDFIKCCEELSAVSAEVLNGNKSDEIMLAFEVIGERMKRSPWTKHPFNDDGSLILKADLKPLLEKESAAA